MIFPIKVVFSVDGETPHCKEISCAEVPSELIGEQFGKIARTARNNEAHQREVMGVFEDG